MFCIDLKIIDKTVFSLTCIDYVNYKTRYDLILKLMLSDCLVAKLKMGSSEKSSKDVVMSAENLQKNLKVTQNRSDISFFSKR